MKRLTNDFSTYILIVIFISVMVARIMTFQLDDESYFSLRQAEQIRQNKFPSFHDSLSYGGRELEEPSLFYYLLALTNSKYVPILLMSFIVIIVYFISLKITEDKGASLVASLFSGFIPASFQYNLFSSATLAFFLILLAIYSLLRIKEKIFFYLFILSSVLLAFTSNLSVFFVTSLLIYVLICSIEKKSSKLEFEVIIFSIFVNLLIYLIIFRKSLIDYGFGIVWENTPKEILAQYFQLNLITSIYLIGALLLIFGVMGLFVAFENEARIIGSFLIVSLMFLGLKLVSTKVGIILFSLFLSQLAALGVIGLLKYVNTTRLSKFRVSVEFLVILLIVVSSVVSSVLSAREYESNIKVSSSVENAFKSIENKGEIIAAPLEYGHVITFYGNKNLIDTKFLLAPNSEQRFEDIQKLYSSSNDINALKILHKYNATFIFVNQDIKEDYNLNDEIFLNKRCFRKFYDDENETKIYGIFC